jgi:hypothetical protein
VETNLDLEEEVEAIGVVAQDIIQAVMLQEAVVLVVEIM